MPSIRCLAKKAEISRESAKKAIAFIDNGEIEFKKRRHDYSGVGSLMSLSLLRKSVFFLYLGQRNQVDQIKVM